jgi:hypothetical protein
MDINMLGAIDNPAGLFGIVTKVGKGVQVTACI